jgi:HD domain
MNQIYRRTTGSPDWQWLLARPGLHWKHGASAMALADAWEHAAGWPEAIGESLASDRALADLTMLLAVPEHEVPLSGGNTASQTDLFVLASGPDAGLVAIAVEGKAKEPFGDRTVSEWRATETNGRRDRLAQLLEVLDLDDDDRLSSIRYQLLHRAASAVIEARRFRARHAVMLVHSFPDGEDWFEDFAAFAELYGATVTRGSTAPVRELSGVTLHLGWASDTPRPADPAPRLLTTRFDRGVALARELHEDQVRKGGQIPYLSHLLGVCSLVLDDGGDEDEAIAGLLHDAVEDQGGQKTLSRIRQQFGERVANIVEACSDTDVIPKPPWQERKEAYIAHLSDPNLPAGTVRVSLADKLHNVRAILFDLRAGEDVFARFKADRDSQLWYYETLTKTFAAVTESPMVDALHRVVTELRVESELTERTVVLV